MFFEITIPADKPGRGWLTAKRSVHVDSNGEVAFRNEGDYAEGTSVDLRVMIRQLLTRNEMSPPSGGEWEDPDHPMLLFSKAELHRLLYQAITDPVERKLILSIRQTQAVIKDKYGRWRLFGGIEDGKPYLFLVTEFCYWISGEDEFWENLTYTARIDGAYLQIMDERPYVDRYAPARGIPGEVLTNDFVHTPHGEIGTRPNDLVWVEGPNHGRRERHVEMLWSVIDYTPEQLVGLIENHLDARTQPDWDKAGVGVM